MSSGENYAKARVDTPSGTFKRATAIILDGDGIILDRHGTEQARLPNATVESHDHKKAVWTNSDETWTISVGCGCGG